MKEFIISNIGTIGQVFGFILLVVIILTAKYWVDTKWGIVISSVIGMCALVGSAKVFETIFAFLIK